MSRRPNPAADKAAANQNTIKALAAQPGNGVCADCGTTHPRWASWNLGIFMCIRCAGVHRGMGTHLSRVKSVELDKWTDEQLQSMLKWGNKRANRYWEAGLDPEALSYERRNIEHFIKKKYDQRRWAMKGKPDPSQLDDADDPHEDNIPLSVVQKKLEERKPNNSRPTSARPTSTRPPPQSSNVDLLSDDSTPTPAATTPVGSSSAPANPTRSASAVSDPPFSKSTKPADSLLGLDFFAAPSPAPSSRPASAQSNPSMPSSSRVDLNRSILSLYASTPKVQPKAPATVIQSPAATMQSPSSFQQPPVQSQASFNNFNSAFESLSFGTPTSPPPPPPPPQPTAPTQPAPFANLMTNVVKSPAGPQLSTSSFGGLNSGSPTPGNGAQMGNSGMSDLFGFGSPAPGPTPKPTTTIASPNVSSFSMDSNAWASTSAASTRPTGSANLTSSSSVSTAPSVQQGHSNTSNDDDWGSFSAVSSTTAKPATGFGDDDLFGNVWK